MFLCLSLAVKVKVGAKLWQQILGGFVGCFLSVVFNLIAYSLPLTVERKIDDENKKRKYVL